MQLQEHPSRGYGNREQLQQSSSIEFQSSLDVDNEDYRRPLARHVVENLRSKVRSLTWIIACLAVLLSAAVVVLLVQNNAVPESWIPPIIPTPPQVATACMTEECVKVAGGILSLMNTTVDPCVDPYQYMCGSFLTNFQLPDEESSWTASFSEIEKTNRYTLKGILENTKCDVKMTSMGNNDEQDGWDSMISCLYQTCMNTDKLDADGSGGLSRYLGDKLPFLLSTEAIAQEAMNLTTQSRRRLLSERLAALHVYGPSALFGMGVSSNVVHPQLNQTLIIAQAGLGIEYAFYTGNDTMSAKFRNAYKKHVANLLMLWMRSNNVSTASEASVALRADAVFSLESSLQTVSLSPVERRDQQTTTNPLPLSGLSTLVTSIDFDLYWDYTKKQPGYIPPQTKDLISGDLEIIVESPSYLEKMSALLDTWSWTTLHDYFLTRMLIKFGGSLSKEWRDEFERYSFEVSGAKPVARWRLCLAYAKGFLPWVLSRTFVRQQFSPQTKAVAEQIMKNIRLAFREEVTSITWMDEETKRLALEKEAMVTQKIGYPDWLLTKDVEYLTRFYGTPRPDLMVTDLVGASAYLELTGASYQISKIRKPKDKTMWSMDPATVNAYYSPSKNEIVFPASILQPPFMRMWSTGAGPAERLALMVLNYGAIGAVMGHELTHGFDDQGSQYDGNGTLKTWWSAESEANFKAATRCMASQYDKYAMPWLGPGVHVHGNLTLGENIADNGGVLVAYRALRKALDDAAHHVTPTMMAKEKETSTSTAFVQRGAGDGANRVLRAERGLGSSVDQTKVLVGMEKASATLLFAVAFSQIWCSKYKPQALRRRVESDPHSPGQFRVTGVMANFKAYSDTLGCPVGSPVNPLVNPVASDESSSGRCVVW